MGREARISGFMYPKVENSLYDSKFEHDACGVGFIANTDGRKERRILDYAIEALCHLAHRGALDADAKTGDGAGVLIQLPREFFRAEIEKMNANLISLDDLAVGMIFLPQDPYKASHCRRIIEDSLKEMDIHLFGWRQTPVGPECLGEKARSTMPLIQQALIGKNRPWDSEEFERRLYLVRKMSEKRAIEEKIEDFYIASFSSQTIVYKGLLNAPQVRKFYKDLNDPRFVTSLAIYHQRYSTNTFPNWRLAQPFRALAHNGEINTLLGNKNWTRAREPELDQTTTWGENTELIKPIIQPQGSDSAALDNVLELLSLSGRDIMHTVTMLAPESWEKTKEMDEKLKAYYEYHACFNEPWDGPAAVVFSDGRYVGATLDRNGLRPARYKIYEDGLMVMGSEVGVVELDDAKVVEKGRLGPGMVMVIDTLEGKLLRNNDVKSYVSNLHPFQQWRDEGIFSLNDHAQPFAPNHDPVNILDLTLDQIVFGFDKEILSEILDPMVKTGMESIGSMGDDTPLAVLSKRPRLIYDYFKQLFAQVTNPPIDSIRERVVMSLSTYMGRRGPWFENDPAHAKMIRVDSPFLLDYELEALRSTEDPVFSMETLSCHFEASSGPAGLKVALDKLCEAAVAAVDAGHSILNLSDRGISKELIPIPMLLAVGAVHHHLIRTGRRMKASIVCESGEVRDVMQFACLVGFGASAVNPYIAIDTIRQKLESGEYEALTMEDALANYRQAIEKGLLKIMSKMGISTLNSYRGAQMFEAIGISSEVMDHCFFGTTSHLGGVTFDQIAKDSIRRHAAAYPADESIAALDEGGFYTVARGGKGEFHAFNPKVVQTLHKFLKTGDRESFLKYMDTVQSRDPVSPRDLFRLKNTGAAVPLEEVDSVESIRSRFTTAGMSLGALSPEAHECLAIAMNKIGGKSNSGEGGEDPERYSVRENGDNASSAIKQVASGRFGVTPEYLASASEIEIKIAQGAKPGEGGQLPGHKVSPLIAKLRYSVPGVPLISPPPHHDIYSIEDLAQLIYDLKQVNPRAKVCVKLVAESGVGTIAAGVAKAYADVILISGHDGGTGASPVSSIKYTGSPFELGLAEAHQTLMLNDLRSRVVLRTDGGLKTGADIIKAALLGAEEFNFGTAALIASGCAMFRVCHLNTCPVGVATQKDQLRLKFRGKPENVIAFFNGVAEEVREAMAALGIRKFDDMVGRTDLLEQRPLTDYPEEIRDKIANLKLSKLLYQVDDASATRIHTRDRNERFGSSTLDDRMITEAKAALTRKEPMSLNYSIHNTYRNIGTRLSGQIAFQYGEDGLPDGCIDVNLNGSAGQSFGAFLAKGVRLRLHGEANDYVGKGMNGGEIIIRPLQECQFTWSENSIIGNTVMYGATGGRLFAAGRAGERFCVRNSGGTAVVEGVGDHGCEYMTGGTVVILGSAGRNFGAGMSGGRAYIYDVDGTFDSLFNKAMVQLEKLVEESEVKQVQSLIFEHLEKTESPRANEILKNWKSEVEKFWVVAPYPPEAQPESKPVHELRSDDEKKSPKGF